MRRKSHVKQLVQCMLKLTSINPIDDGYVVRLFDLPIQVVGRLVVDNLQKMLICTATSTTLSINHQAYYFNFQSQNLICNHGKSKSFHPLANLPTQVQQRLFACDQRQSK